MSERLTRPLASSKGPMNSRATHHHLHPCHQVQVMAHSYGQSPLVQNHLAPLGQHQTATSQRTQEWVPDHLERQEEASDDIESVRWDATRPDGATQIDLVVRHLVDVHWTLHGHFRVRSSSFVRTQPNLDTSYNNLQSVFVHGDYSNCMLCNFH